MKLLDKMYKYEMDPASIVEDTEWTGFCPQTDRWHETNIPSFQLLRSVCVCVGYNNKDST